MGVSEAYEPPKQESLPPAGNSKSTSLLGRITACVISLLVVGVLIGMFLPPMTRGVRPAARRTVCLNNMRQVALAMHNFQSEHGHFPPAYIADENGKPMHSWRVLLLPYLDRQDLFERYSMKEPWDGPNNQKLADEFVEVFSCPSHDQRHGESNCTSYCIVTGEGTMFDADRTVDFSDIRDGSSNTVVLLEVNRTDIHWMEPRDLTVDEAVGVFEQVSNSEQDGNHPGLQNVAFADGSTRTLTTSTTGNELLNLFLIADESGDPEKRKN